jgi:HEAT repeat protein
MRPPDLPSPSRLTKDAPKKQSPSPRADRSDAEALGEELVKAAPEQQEAILEKLGQGKGTEYTQALAIAIGQLTGESKEKARQTLVNRLTRFTSTTLQAYLGNEAPELRRAAALAVGKKGFKDRIGDLIDLLDDPEPSVVQAANGALQNLTKQDSAAGSKAAAAEPVQTHSKQQSQPPGETSPSSQRVVVGKAKAPSVPLPKAKPTKKDEDLPDVALVPPPETSSEVMAIIRSQAIALHSRKAEERIQAAQALGGLGEDGKPARRLLCAAMLDPVSAVRVAAADALKNIDPKMHYLAVVLATEKVATDEDVNRVANLLEKIQKIEEDGEPLVPLVAYALKFAASNDSYPLFIRALTTLGRIGRKDLASYRVIASALTHRDMRVRAVALHEVARMKHGKLAVPRILVLLRQDTPANRIAAMEALAALADESTEEIIDAAIAEQRYHDSEEVRRAVEAARNKLENKHN